MTDAKELLDGVKRRRKVEDALDSLRRQTRRNIPRAIWNFALGVLFAWLAYGDGVVTQVNGEAVLLYHGCIELVVSFCFLSAGIRELWVSPRDRLLIQIAEDYLSRKEEPHGATQSTERSGPDWQRSARTVATGDSA